MKARKPESQKTSARPKKFLWFVVTTLVVCIDSKATEVATTNTKNQFGQALVHDQKSFHGL
jgi:hypothetical protein